MIQAVNLIDKQNVAFLEIRQQCRQIARALHHRSRRSLDVNTHLPGDNVSERGLAQSRWSMEQNMIQDIVASPRRGNRDFKIFLYLLLTDVLIEAPRPQIRSEEHTS